MYQNVPLFPQLFQKFFLYVPDYSNKLGNNYCEFEIYYMFDKKIFAMTLS